MLAVEELVLDREQILSQIRDRCERLGRNLEQVLADYARGDLRDFGELAEVYALCELLEGDDEVFKVA